jgi:hypothetical protein
MHKMSEENKSTPRLLGMNNIVTAMILPVLIFSLLVNILILNKLSKIPGYLLSQDVKPASGSADSIISEQDQGLYLKMDPALDKIRYLQQQIIDREVIRDDCLIGVPIDNQLKEDIREYNRLVPGLKGFFAEQAIRTLIAVLELEIEDELVKRYGGANYELYAPDYPDIPSDVREYAEIIAELSLYRNCTELLSNDSRLAFIIYSEGGGSYGMWPSFWHTEYLRDREDIKENLNRLFNLVEKIITSLDKEYENIYYIKQE